MNMYLIIYACIIYLLCANVLPTYMYVHHMCAWWLWQSEEGVGMQIPWIVLTDIVNYHVDDGN